MQHFLFVCCFFTALHVGAQELPVLSPDKLEADFTLLVHALEEAHTGLYWYTPKDTFEAAKAAIRKELTESGGQTSLQFYATVAPLVALTREDHCDINLSEEADDFLIDHGRFFPYSVKFCGTRAFLMSSGQPYGTDLNGYELLRLNGQPLSEIVERLFATFAADGYIQSSKYRWLDDIGFSRLYAQTIDWNPESFQVQVRPPQAETAQLVTVQPTGLRSLVADFKALNNPLYSKAHFPAHFERTDAYALLTIQTFSAREYRKAGMRFEPFIDSCFRVIAKNGVINLIIDVRANGGGTEGYEDYLFSWLMSTDYRKYRFVETNALSYSFTDFTDYADPKERKAFEQLLRKEFRYDAASGKFRRKASVERPEKPRKNAYAGKLYVLAGGVTYSGGAEFSSLVRHHRKAVFVGEEVGGGYYGNTSGYSFTLTLPNSQVRVEIPLVRFALDVSGQPEGTGALPDHAVQPEITDFLKGIDTELNYTIGLIGQQH